MFADLDVRTSMFHGNWLFCTLGGGPVAMPMAVAVRAEGGGGGGDGGGELVTRAAVGE